MWLRNPVSGILTRELEGGGGCAQRECVWETNVFPSISSEFPTFGVNSWLHCFGTRLTCPECCLQRLSEQRTVHSAKPGIWSEIVWLNLMLHRRV